MKQLIAYFLLLISIPAAAQTFVDAQAKKRNVSPFHAIEASSGIEVVIAQGQEIGLAVSASSDEVDQRVITQVVDGVLKIGVENDWKFWKMTKTWRIKVYVSYTSLTDLKASSGASIKGQFEGNSLTCKQNSGGTIAISGHAEKLEIEANSGGIFKGYDFTANFLQANVNSGGGAQVTVKKEITAKANSGGFVTYKGDAIIRSIDVNSGGSVRKSTK